MTLNGAIALTSPNRSVIQRIW